MLLNTVFSVSSALLQYWGQITFNLPWTFDSCEGRCDGGIRAREITLRNTVYPCRHCLFPLGRNKQGLRPGAEDGGTQV